MDEHPPVPIDLTTIIQKLDALEKSIGTLSVKPEPKSDNKPPEKAKEIVAAESAFRVLLADSYPKEKLDAWNLDELVKAHDVKTSFKPPKQEKQLPDPPVGKKDDQTKDEKKPPWLYARPESINQTTGGTT